MTQIWIYDHFLNKKDIIVSDVQVKNFDCITPQITTFEIPRNDKIEDSDIVIIKGENEFLGVVESITQNITTQVGIYPFEHIFDSDLEVDNLDGTSDVVTYLQAQITRNFIDTDDPLVAFPIVFENTLAGEATYKIINDTQNLLAIMNEIYLNTGVYCDYEPVYTDGKFSAIKVIFKNVAEQPIRRIKYDNPQIVDNVKYEFSNTTANKVTIWVGKTDKEKGKAYRIYLREDNELTSNPKDPKRIKKVLNKNIDFTADKEVDTDEEYAEAIINVANSELKSQVFGYQIEFTILKNPLREWHYRQACVFTAQDRTFYTLVTRLEHLSDKHLRITLGAYRTRLHEKILKLAQKPKELGGTLGGIAITNGLGQYLYWFEQDAEGNLYVCSDNLSTEELSAMFEVDANKNLYVNYKDTQREALAINADGELEGSY